MKAKTKKQQRIKHDPSDLSPREERFLREAFARFERNVRRSERAAERKAEQSERAKREAKRKARKSIFPGLRDKQRSEREALVRKVNELNKLVALYNQRTKRRIALAEREGFSDWQLDQFWYAQPVSARDVVLV